MLWTPGLSPTQVRNLQHRPCQTAMKIIPCAVWRSCSLHFAADVGTSCQQTQSNSRFIGSAAGNVHTDTNWCGWLTWTSAGAAFCCLVHDVLLRRRWASPSTPRLEMAPANDQLIHLPPLLPQPPDHSSSSIFISAESENAISQNDK